MYFLNREQKLISQIKNLLGATGRFIGDDCAILPGGLLITSDSLIENTHFRLDWTNMEDLGWKAMTANLSDIAAMAGIPEYAVVALSAPEDFYLGNKVLPLYRGINACCEQYKTHIVGGDITHGPVLSINITLLGRVHCCGVLQRRGAKIGDVVVVTGDFGASAAGLALLKKNNSSSFTYCLNRHRHPQARLKESHLFVEITGSAGALMDASDGLADALAQISHASNVGMRIDLKAIPIHEETRAFAAENNINLYDLALYGGEDYELVGCLPYKTWQDWQKDSPEIASFFTPIGTVTDENIIRLMFGNEPAPQLDLTKIFQHIA